MNTFATNSMKNRKNKKNVTAGRIGGSVTTRKKAKAARLNGAKGGRPRKARLASLDAIG